MTTSLALQLKQLAVPQTQALLGTDTRKVSFLFDPKKAAETDRETFFCLGANALEELIGLDEGFEQYESSLFNATSMSFERSIQTQEVNEQLDRSIDSFLLRLSPFLQLTCAHGALEWLIQRYRIHLNNVDSLVQCFLPYHELDLFPRMLQLLDLKAHKNKKWGWLISIQKNALHLPRQVLVNHCRSDPACLSIVTDIVPRFITVFNGESKNRDSRLQRVVNFYGLTLLALVQSGPITEQLLSVILPVLCRGLKSDMVDFTAASYVIVMSIMSKTSMKTSLLETIMNGICKNLTKSQLKHGLTVLIYMFQTQQVDKIAKKSFKRLSRLSALPTVLSELSAQCDVSRFVTAIFKRLIPIAVRAVSLDVISGSSSSYSSEDEAGGSGVAPICLVHDLLAHVDLDSDTRTLAIKLVLENFVQHCGGEDVDRREAVGKVRQVVRIFETRYSESLDIAVDSVMSGTEGEAERNTIKEFLNLTVASVHHRLLPDSHTTLALSLHHPNYAVRINALHYLMDKLDSIEDRASVKESFLARLQDDNPKVVTLLLKNPQKLWSVFEDKSELTSALLTKLKSSDTNVENVQLVKELLEVLSQGESSVTMDTLALSHLLLASPESSSLQLAVDLLTSPLASSSTLLFPLKKAWLPKVKKMMSKSGDSLGEEELSALNTSLFDEVAATVASLDSPILRMSELEREMEGLSCLRQRCMACLLTEVSLRLAVKLTGEDDASKVRLQFARMLDTFIHDKKLLSQRAVKSDATETDVYSDVRKKLCKGRSLPMTWWTDLLTRWMSSLSVPQQLKGMEFWHSISADSAPGRWLQAVVKVTEMLLHLKSDLSDISKQQVAGLQKVFGSVETYLCYLCVLWAGDRCEGVGVTRAVRDKSLHLTQAYLAELSDAEITAIVQSPAPVVPCLMLVCVSEGGDQRDTALSIMSMLSDRCASNSALCRSLLELVMHYKQEISLDITYLPTALTGLKTKGGRRKSKQTDTLSSLLKVVESSNTPPFVASALLQALSGIDTMDTLTPLLPLLTRLLECDSLDEGQAEVVRLLLARYTPTIAPNLTHDAPSLQLLVEAIRKPITTSGTSLQQLAMAQISKKFFAALPSLESQRCVAGCLLDVLQTSTETETASHIRKVFERVSLPADLLSEELTPILQGAATSVREVKRMRKETTEEKSTFNSAAWIRTTVLLEMMQTKKKIPHSRKLVPVSFQILTKVLEVEDAGEGEYLKQIILSVIHNLCKHLSVDNEPIEGKDLNLESIVQCIRTSNDPHTHQHALLVLSICAQIAPEQLLHSVMSVFTFMGASILRQDDSYSFQVITRILETVFPALVKACEEHKKHEVKDMVTMILRVFVDTYPHIPEHRKLTVFSTLMRVVGAESHLWRLLLVFIEGVATRNKATATVTDSSTEQEAKQQSKTIDQVHMDFIISLVVQFSPLHCLQMAHKALQYLASLPNEKSGDSKQKARRQSVSVLQASREECEIFSLAFHTTKQLHKFRHATLLLLHNLLASRQFIALMSDNLDGDLLQALKTVLETLLAYMSQCTTALQSLSLSPQAPYWKGLVTKCNMLLDSLVSLLPQEQFLAVVRELLDSPLVAVQRKALELASARLRHLKDTLISSQQKTILLDLVPRLQTLVGQLREEEKGEGEEGGTGRMALFTLMLMARVLGMECHVTFVEVLRQVCQVMGDERVHSEAVATAMLCAAEIVSNVRAHAIVHLPLIVPVILQQLQAVSSTESELLPCCVTSLHKIMDTLPHFMSPYLQDILSQVCHIQTLLGEGASSKQREHILHSLKHTSQLIASLQPRVFLPTLETCYTALIESGRQESIASLLSVLGQHLNNMSRDELQLCHHQLLDFFLVALDFRVTQRKEVSREVVDRIEGAVINTILSMVLKMTEGTMRPMLLKMFEWATKEGKRDRVMAFYRLSDCLVGSLRGLFLQFAAHIFKHATLLLDLLHSSKAETPYLKKDKKGRKSSKLLVSLLNCLQKICLFDTQNFINKERFTMLIEPLLDQLENFVGGEEEYRKRVDECLVPAIADFAAAAKNDSLWQTLNYQLMMKTRSKKKEVRLSSLHALKGLHRKLGEDYVSLMPETIPFLSELMEDDCEEVEALTQEVIRDMEETFGEPLQKYFN